MPGWNYIMFGLFVMLVTRPSLFYCSTVTWGYSKLTLALPTSKTCCVGTVYTLFSDAAGASRHVMSCNAVTSRDVWCDIYHI